MPHKRRKKVKNNRKHKMVKSAPSDLIVNKKAFHNYQVLEKFEAGIELVGTEVKSCRARNITIADSYVIIKGGELFLLNVNISQYSHGNQFNHEPARERKLLMHKREIRKLKVAVEAKGLTLVPLKFYIARGKIKVKLGLCRGKNVADKRDTLKQRAADMDARRAMKNI